MQSLKGGGGAVAGETGSEGYRGGKLLSPERRRCAVEHAREKQELSERHACRLVNQWCGTPRYLPIQRTDEDASASQERPSNRRICAATGVVSIGRIHPRIEIKVSYNTHGCG
jgi:hypothetical protein